MNDDIRKSARAAGVKLWQVAEELGISEFTFSRRLRHELPDNEKAEVFRAIEGLATRREG